MQHAKAIADRMSIQTAKDTALSTSLIGAAMGGGAVGSLLNKFAKSSRGEGSW